MARELLASRAENEAIRQEMERDSTVIMLGEDIAGAAGRAEQGFIDAWGGPMGSTKGLIQQFGPGRIIDTPICEMSFIGAAVGAAKRFAERDGFTQAEVLIRQEDGYFATEHVGRSAANRTRRPPEPS